MNVTSVERAEILCNVFASQCSAQPANTIPVCPRSSTEFRFEEVSRELVKRSLQQVKSKKAAGLDNIYPRILQECALELSLPLAHVFNLSLSSGVFPHQWKVARIQPVFKQKGDRSDPARYRPIALLCSISKVLETFAHKQLLAFCMAHKVIPDEQYGFLPGRSTVWQLLSLTDEWHEALDSGNSVHGLFLDFSKAFDRVDHKILISKLQSIGVSDSSLSWFKCYLDGRSIVTRVNHTLSAPQRTTSGVPQGSVLGPLLFLLYVADLPSVPTLSSSCTMFADDSLLHNASCKAMSKICNVPCCDLQADATSVQEWADSWNSIFNASKSCHMIFHRSASGTHSSQSIVLKDITVPFVTSTRHLGVLFSSNLKWSEHIDSIMKNVGWKFALLKRLSFRCNLSLTTLSRVYTTLLRPCLEYASVVWDNCSSSDSLSIEKLQIALARSALFHRRFPAGQLSKSDVLKALGWPTLAWRRRRSKLLLLWKLYNGKGPPHLASKLSSVSSRCSYSLRNPQSIELQRCSTSARLSSFLPSTSVLWNSLPAPITSSSNISSFKQCIDHHFSGDFSSFGLPP